MSPRNLFAYNLSMITGMLLFYFGGFLLYPTENQGYGIFCLSLGVVIFVTSIQKIIYGMAKLKHSERFKTEGQILHEINQKGHRRRKLNQIQLGIGFVGWVVLVLVSYIKLSFTWILVLIVLFLLAYLHFVHQIYRLDQLDNRK
ncbi:MAG TPA: hypothetical protein H9667_08580 [Firmicutes bacterium]|nr:hypothetical protein [Bacillales bacterium]HJA41550.1 hypothetical protein [Bacillota bacterium]